MNRDPNDNVSVLSHILDATIAMVMLMSMAVLLMAVSSDSDASSGVTFGDFDEQESTVVATITRDATGDVDVPATITSGGKVYNVIGIHTESTPVLNEMTSLYVPESVSTIHTRLFHWDSPSLTSITVDPDNQVYSSDGGVLFSKDGTELISCPISLNGESYTVPNGVREIGNYAFYNCTGLRSLTVPSTIRSINSDAFSGIQFKDVDGSNIFSMIKLVGFKFEGEDGVLTKCNTGFKLDTNGGDTMPDVIGIEGKIISAGPKRDGYVFEDATGKITIELDAKLFQGRTVTPENKVRLYGEVDTKTSRPSEVDVEWFEVL